MPRRLRASDSEAHGPTVQSSRIRTAVGAACYMTNEKRPSSCWPSPPSKGGEGEACSEAMAGPTRLQKEWSRREFTSALAATAIISLAAPGMSVAAALKSGSSTTPRKKIALLATEVRKYSHAQHFIDRFLEGYGWQGEHHRPHIELAGLYVDQFPDRDLSRERARRHRLKIYPT